MKLVNLSFVLVAFIILAVPDSASAQGFLPCDGSTDSPCNSCHIAVVANYLISWLIGVIMVLFSVLAVVAGFGLVTSGGNPAALTAAKSKMTNAFIGLLIVLSAWLIVDTLMRGILGGNGEIRGYGPWSEIQCTTQSGATVEADELSVVYIEADLPDLASTVPQTPGTFATYTYDTSNNCQTFATRSYDDPLACQSALSDLRAFGGSLIFVYQGCDGNTSTLNRPSWFGAPSCGFSAATVGDLSVNGNMGPIFDTADGGSTLVRAGATEAMQRTLSGPFARLQSGFGRRITINDAIAKAGTSRETNTRDSQHFFGTALDLSTAGMSNADKLRLFREAKIAGFTGFGFGVNILHVDTGAKRAWDYGNSTYGGVSVGTLKAEARE